MVSKGGLIVHGVIWVFFLAGLYDVFYATVHRMDCRTPIPGENACEMSYMYEKPQFRSIPLDPEIEKKYPNYGLHLYGEGHYFKLVSGLQLEGIPVLYIPGNMGSMKQCRSIASILLRKAENRNWDVHFNVFTVDLNEESSAFFGGTLNDQVDFVHYSIKAILQLYDNSGRAQIKPHSVILAAHSMGGIVARGVLSLPDFDTETISVLYTFASPLSHPVLSIDAHISEFYRNVNSYWEKNCEKLKNVNVVSVSGGDRDIQVHGAVTRFPQCRNNSISTATTSVPRAWVSADHNCVVWCKQIVLTTTRSMFDMIDQHTKQVTADVALRAKVLKHHFSHNSGVSKYLAIGEQSKFKLLSSHAIKTVSDMEWSSKSREVGEGPCYYFFDLKSMQDEEKVFAVARTSTKSERWILGCDSPDCSSVTDLSLKGYVTPMFKVAKLNITELHNDGISHLVFKVPKETKTSGRLDVNFLSSDELERSLTVPHIFSNLWTMNKGYAWNDTIGKTKSRFYQKITLTGLYSIFHAYKFTFTPVSSSGSDGPQMIELQLPDRPSYAYSTNNEITVKLRNTAGDQVPALHIYTDGKTEYAIQVKVQFMQLLGQILRFDGVIILAMVALNGMLVLSYQLKLVLSGKKCPSTSEAHGSSAKPYKLQPFINLVKALYSYPWFFAAWHYMGLPVPDAVHLDEFGVWFALLSLVLFLFGQEIYLLMVFVETKLVQMFGSVSRKFLGLTVAEDFKPTFTSSTVHTVVLASLASQSGGLALLYICFLNFVDLCGLSVAIPESKKDNGSVEKNNGDAKLMEDKGESNPKAEKQESGGETQCFDDPAVVNYHLKLSMQLLWMCLAIFALPSVAARAKGYSFRSGDPSLASAIFGSLIFLLHRQQSATLQPSTARRLTCRLLYPLTVFASMLCLHSLYRLPYFILCFQSIYVAMQYFG